MVCSSLLISKGEPQALLIATAQLQDNDNTVPGVEF